MNEDLLAAVARLLAAPIYGNGDDYDDPEGFNKEFWAALANLRKAFEDEELLREAQREHQEDS